jgi:hypothetical protein
LFIRGSTPPSTRVPPPLRLSRTAPRLAASRPGLLSGVNPATGQRDPCGAVGRVCPGGRLGQLRCEARRAGHVGAFARGAQPRWPRPRLSPRCRRTVQARCSWYWSRRGRAVHPSGSRRSRHGGSWLTGHAVAEWPCRSRAVHRLPGPTAPDACESKHFACQIRAITPRTSIYVKLRGPGRWYAGVNLTPPGDLLVSAMSYSAVTLAALPRRGGRPRAAACSLRPSGAALPRSTPGSHPDRPRPRGTGPRPAAPAAHQAGPRWRPPRCPPHRPAGHPGRPRARAAPPPRRLPRPR